MKVYFHEIKDHDLQYQFDESTPWIMEVIGGLDERIDRIQRPPNWKPRSRPTQISLTLRRVDDLIHVTGKINTQLYLICSLCAEPFAFPIHTQFHVLLTTSEVYAEVPRESRKGNLDIGSNVDSRGFEPDDDFDDEDDEDSDEPPMNLNASDFEVNVLKEPVIELKDLLNEQIVLILPMQPKHSADDSSKCGRNQASMVGTVKESDQPLKENPFAILKDYKKKTDS